MKLTSLVCLLLSACAGEEVTWDNHEICNNEELQKYGIVQIKIQKLNIHSRR